MFNSRGDGSGFVFHHSMPEEEEFKDIDNQLDRVRLITMIVTVDLNWYLVLYELT